MFSVIWKGYALKHVSSLRRGASRHCSLSGYLAGKEKSMCQCVWMGLKQWSHTRGLLTALVAGAQAAPSRDLAHCPVSGTLWRQRSRAYKAVQSDRAAQFDQHYVAVLRAGVVIWMADELGRHNVLLRPIRFPYVMLSQPDFHIWPRHQI